MATGFLIFQCHLFDTLLKYSVTFLAPISIIPIKVYHYLNFIIMDKEDLIVEIESRMGLTSNNLKIDFNEAEEVKIKYDLGGYELNRPVILDEFWEKLSNLPSARSREINAESKQLMINRAELESFIKRFDPPVKV